jgi:phosphate uptake regulator
MIIVSRCLERIGDHAVDIGEQTAYLVNGRVPRIHGRVASSPRLKWPAATTRG